MLCARGQPDPASNFRITRGAPAGPQIISTSGLTPLLVYSLK